MKTYTEGWNRHKNAYQ